MNDEEIITKRFLRVLESVNFGLLVEGEHRKIILVNQAFLDLFKIPLKPDNFINMDCEEAAKNSKQFFKDEKQFMDRIHKILDKKEKVLNDVLELKDGRIFERDYFPIFIKKNYRGHAWLYKDITEKSLMEKKLIKMATTDALTEAYNRRKFHDELNKHIDLSKRYGGELSLILFDIDNFKAVNDNYGHHAGDEVLKKISQTILKSRRKVDIFGRWGGEEFIILLPKTGLNNAIIIAERFRIQIKELQFESLDYSITASFGVSQYSVKNTDNDFIIKADEALYEAKKTGKDKVCFKNQ